LAKTIWLDAKTRLMELKRQASILDLVSQDAKRLSVSLGADRQEKGRGIYAVDPRT
jgi:hypothetical protein